jgi:hypothetical protein
MIIAYIKGEPIISIFEKKDTLFTGDHDYPEYDYNKNSSGIRWISTLETPDAAPVAEWWMHE